MDWNHPKIKDKLDTFRQCIPLMRNSYYELMGAYVERAVILISFDFYFDGMTKEEYRFLQSQMFAANDDFRKKIHAHSYLDLQMSVETNLSSSFVVYAVDKYDNVGWRKNNPDCGFLKQVPNYKGECPISYDTNKVLNKFWEKYPFTRI